MTSIAVICVSLAAVCFCMMHIVARIFDYKKEKEADGKIEEVKNELEEEIVNGGNIARIVQLRKRLQELRSS